MSVTLKRESAGWYRVRCSAHLVWITVTAISFLGCIDLSLAQTTSEIRRTFAVSVAQPLILDIEVDTGDLQILYGRDGQVSLSGFAKAFAGVKLDDHFFASVLSIDQQGNDLRIRQVPNLASSDSAKGISVRYRIDVPYRTEVTARVKHGDLNISGILGPVKATGGKGDIKVSYISKAVQVQTEQGNLDLQVIGERVEATTASGNIVCARTAQGVNAETGDGDIDLMAIGPSEARVTRGNGRIDVGGASGRFVGSTNAGDLHIRAVPRGDWQLHSASGNIRVELPPAAKFEFDAATQSGKVLVDRDDIARPDEEIRHIHDQVNGGGKLIEAQSEAGTIMIR